MTRISPMIWGRLARSPGINDRDRRSVRGRPITDEEVDQLAVVGDLIRHIENVEATTLHRRGDAAPVIARIAIMKRSATGKQADGLTCDDVFRCSGLCDFCNALEFF